ncbi:MAG: tetratricopeptide repeat protein [Myxococcota bacterium]
MSDVNEFPEPDISAMEVSDAEVERYLNGEVELRDLLGLDTQLLEQIKGRAQFFVDGEHSERALILLEMLEELDRNDRTASLIAIEVLLREGLSDRAQAKVEMLLTRAPEDPDVLVAKAQYELAVGRWHEAAATLERVIEADPGAEAEATQRALVLAQAAHAEFEASRGVS